MLDKVCKYIKHFCLRVFKVCSIHVLDIVNCENDDGCHDNATCTDDNGSYMCVCKDGFTGDGFVCTGNV